MRSLRILVALLGLVVVAAVVLHAISLETLRAPIGRALSARVGRPVEIAGPIRIGLVGALSFDVGDVTVSELPGIAHVGRIELELALAPLLRGEIDVREVILTDGRVELEEAIAPGGLAASGAGAPSPAPAAESGVAVSFHVRRVEVRDHLIVHTNASGLVTTLDLARLEVEAPERAGPVRAEAAGSFDGLRFDVTVDLGASGARGAAFPIALRGHVAGMDLTAHGGVDDPRTLAGLEVDVALAAPDLSALPAATARRLAALGAFTARARVSNRDGTFGLENGVVEVGGAEDALRVKATGAIDDLDGLDEIAFRVSLEAPDLDAIGDLLGTTLPRVAGVSLQGAFRGTDESLDSEHFSLRLGRTNVEGRFSARLVPGSRPRVTGQLESAVVYLADVGLEAPEDARARGASAGGEGIDLDAPLPLAAIPPLDARIAVHAGEVRGHADLLIDDVGFDFALDRSGVGLENVRVVFAKGAVTARARLQTDTAPPTATFDLDTAAVQVGRVMAQFEPEPSLSGSLDTSLGLVSRGRTLAGLRRNLGGRATFLVTGGEARSAYVQALVFDLRRAVLGSDAPEKFEKLECVIGDFEIERGVARVRSLWLETTAMAIDGSGAVDLGAETFALTLVPRPKQRKLLETTPTVSLSGSFAAPVVTAQKASLATSAAKGLLSRVTRPLDRLLGPVRPLVNPITQPVLKPMSPILDTFFDRQGGGQGPCAGYLAARAAAASAAEPPAR